MAIGEALTALQNNREITPAEITEAKLSELRQDIEDCSPEQTEECIQILEAAISRARGSAATNLSVLLANVDTTTGAETPTEHRTTLPDNDYRELATAAIRDTTETRNDRELFIFQEYYNDIHQPHHEILVDGIAGEQSRTAILTHIRATQMFLNVLGAQSASGMALAVNGDMDSDTVNAIREHFGIEIEPATTEAAAEAIREAAEELNNLSIEELVSRLEAAETVRDKGALAATLANKFREAGYIISLGENNSFQIINGESPVNLDISEENLGAIMVLMSINYEDLDNNVLDQNIANNIFDGVVEQYDFKKTDGTAWTAQDFIINTVRTSEDVERNKQACIGQIEGKITELTAALEEDGLNNNQKEEIREEIQKLEIAKIFVLDRSILSRDSLIIAQHVGNTERDIAGLLGVSVSELRRNGGGPTRLGDIREFAMSQIPTAIIAGFFMLLAKLLPSPLEEAAMAFIGGIAALSVAEDAQARGWLGNGQGDPDGTNQRPNVRMSGTPNEMAEWMRTILTNAPNGLEQRHEEVYARMVRRNNETDAGFFERDQLDTMYLSLSQDYAFGNHDVSELENLDENAAWELLSPDTQTTLEGQGISRQNILQFIRLLKEEHGDTEDQKIRDMFVVGQISETENNLDITWVNGFDERNRTINRNLVQISGLSFGVSQSLRGDSLRAEVEEILAGAQPGYLAWAAASVLDRVNLELDETNPTVESINTIITSLGEIIGRTGDNALSVEDLAAVGNIKIQYEEIKNSLESTQTVDTYIAEASAIYTLVGGAGRAFENVVSWIQGWNNPVPINEAEPITPEMVAGMITRGETLAGNHPDQAERINEVINDLRLYRINMLDEEAAADPSRAGELRRQSDEVLAAVIAANPTAYFQTLENLQTSLAELGNTQSSTGAYMRLLNGNISELTTLQRLSRINANVEHGGVNFNTRADEIYAAVYTNGIESNFKTHLTTKIQEMTDFSTEATTLDEIRARQEAFNTLRGELFGANIGAEIMTFFGIAESYTAEIGGSDYLVITELANRAFGEINPDYTNIVFNASTAQAKFSELELARTNVEREVIDDRIESIEVDGTNIPWGNIDTSNENHITAIITAVQNRQTAINQITEDRIRQRSEEVLNSQISEVIDDFVTRIPTEYDDDSINALTLLHIGYDRIKNEIGIAENNAFETAYEVRMREIAEYRVLNVRIIDANADGLSSVLGSIAVAIGAGRVESGDLVFVEDHPFTQDYINPTLDNVDDNNDKTLFEMFESLNQLATNVSPDTRQEIEQLKNQIIRILEPGIPEVVSSWIQDTYGSMEEYYNRFYQILN